MALRGVLDHPKFGALKDLLKLTKYQTLGLLEALWHFTARYTPAGNLGKYTDNEIALWLEWTGDPKALISALIACRWLDVDKRYRLLVHDWPDSADEAVHGQLARRLERFANGELPRTRRLNSNERKRYNEAIEAGHVVIKERTVSVTNPAMTVQDGRPEYAGYAQGFVDSVDVDLAPCTMIAVPVPDPVPDPVPAPVPVPGSAPVPARQKYQSFLEGQKTSHPQRQKSLSPSSEEIIELKKKIPAAPRKTKDPDGDDFF